MTTPLPSRPETADHRSEPAFTAPVPRPAVAGAAAPGTAASGGISAAGGPPGSRRGLLGRYASLPRLAGPGFIPLGLFARVPLAMLTVGVLTLVTSVSHSYAIGGLAAGAVGIGSAAGAPVLGFLADKFGQRHVLLSAAVLNALTLAAVVVLTYRADGFASPAVAMVLGAALLSGATSPQVGPLARVRWMSLSVRLPAGQRDAAVETALSYESTADELTFALGPALVGILASLVAPWLPLVLAAVMTLLLVSLFAVHPTEATVLRHRKAEPGPGAETAEPVSLRRLAVPVLGMVCMGTFFGGAQTGLIAFTGSFSASELAGLLYAVMGLSSAVAALSVAYWPARFSHPRRWVTVAALMTVLSPLLLLPASVPAMIAVLLVLGIPVGPAMVTIFSVGGLLAPRRWLGTIMTALASGIVAGSALGSALAGSVAQSSGYAAAFLVSLAAAAGLFILGIIAAMMMRGRTVAAGVVKTEPERLNEP
ncbi:MFS transporter [Paenarthrobacter sp. PH39-S1]|uniref:MFS transporter n=1 Tax=Paenarthrobacter sp. PH39-S1 TaxID=3046204 RepID=UPI0024B8822C|nr:MFS transporter [Paenarthrobacter sp. PH39-S1]MDJ0358337.1 MFS transporter [Paenarthrobacter sp. PH39-S1]